MKSTARCVLAFFALVSAPGWPGTTAQAAMPPPERVNGWVVHRPRPSWALESMLRDRLARGEPVPGGIVKRFGLDQPPAWSADAEVMALSMGSPGEARPLHVERANGLGADHLVNDRSVDAGSCAGCGFLLHIQSETTIAAWQQFLLAGWNDSKGFCDNTSVHGWGWSLDGGATWFDAGGVPPLPTGGRYRGDPVHGVNRATGEFYVCGLYEAGANGSGVACLRGHFTGGTFVVDDNREVAIGGLNFLDKPWMTVDSLSGHVYVSWTSFTATGDEIDYQALDASLNPIGPMQVLSAPAADGLVQGSRLAVGPAGEVYAAWYQLGLPQSEIHVRRSNDFGSTFGTDITATTFFENSLNGAPGYLREFAPNLPSLAVDASTGPHRGRVYVAWDETVDFQDTPFSSIVTTNEVENDGFFASATAFTPGAVIAGGFSSTSDVDFFKFTGNAGQTLVMRTDAIGDPSLSFALRIVCPSETTTFNQYRFQAYTATNYPEICYTLPVTGTYLVRLNSVNTIASTYSISTAWDTPSLDQRANHNREKFASWSDGGASWSTPVRISDSQYADGIFPEIAVDGLGRAWCYWHDFRDDPVCGAESYEYVTASGDGGLTWGPNQPLSDVRSFWPPNTCRKPNQGDYQGVTAIDNRLVACWSDARFGDPDAFVEAAAFQLSFNCPAGPVNVQLGQSVQLNAAIMNSGSATRPVAWSTSNSQEWSMDVVPANSGVVPVGPGGQLGLQITLHAPANCSGVPNTVRVFTRDPLIAGRQDTCEVAVTCSTTTGVPVDPPGTLALARPRPNPSTDLVNIEFTLPRAAHATLEVIGAGGRRIRTLVDSDLGPGSRVQPWDGRDLAGNRVPPGAYWVRLKAAGQERTQVIMRVR